LKNNFDVTIFAFDSEYYPPKFRKISNKQILLELKKRKPKKYIRYTKSLIKFLENGGKHKLKIVTIEDIKNAIKSKNPPILNIERKSLYGKGAGAKGHFVITSGFTKNKITINDPHYTYGGVKTYTPDQILFALYSWGGYVLFAKPKK